MEETSNRLGKEGHSNNEQTITSQGAVGDVDKEKGEGDETQDRRSPCHVEQSRGLVDSVGIDTLQGSDATIAPACTIRGVWLPLLGLLGLLLVLCPWSVTLKSAASLGSSGNDHRLLIDEPDQDTSRLAADSHTPVDVVVGSQTLSDLHESDANSQPDTFANVRRRPASLVRFIRIGRELNEIPERKGTDDLDNAGIERTDAADPKLNLERLVHGPEQRVLVTPLNPLLERLLHLQRQRLNGSVWIDRPNVVFLKGTSISGLSQVSFSDRIRRAAPNSVLSG